MTAIVAKEATGLRIVWEVDAAVKSSGRMVSDSNVSRMSANCLCLLDALSPFNGPSVS